MTTPTHPKIYHIVHADRLPSIIATGSLLSDAQMEGRTGTGTTIGMRNIKERRLNELQLTSHPGLYVGQCVPFYFCPRSIMLYMIYRGNHPDLQYRSGQQPILHFEADLRATVRWANQNDQRWAFTLSNAGARYFEDRNDLGRLGEIDWAAVQAEKWQQKKDGKQAEFLIENRFPWHLIERIGAFSDVWANRAQAAIQGLPHKPGVEICREWYYP